MIQDLAVAAICGLVAGTPALAILLFSGKR